MTIRFSRLKHIARSPAHYLYNLTHDLPDTLPLRRGRYIHWKLLGAAPDGNKPFAVYEGGDRRGKEWTAFAAAHEACDIVKASEVEEWDAVVAAIRADPFAAKYLARDVRTERRVTATMHGRVCSGTIDLLSEGVFIGDPKTTRDATVERFDRDAWRLEYPAQLAWYRDLCVAAGIDPGPETIIIAAETSAPYPVVVRRLTAAALDEGRRRYLSWLDVLASCEAAQTWPGPAQTVVDLDVPTWMQQTEVDEDEESEDE